MQHYRHDAERRYEALRQQAYADAEAEFQNALGFSVRVTAITEEAMAQAENWVDQCPPDRLSHLPGWSWRKEVRKFRRRPRRVEVAIWHDDELLCGLALGRTSDRRVVATIHFLQGNPLSDNPLSGMIGQLATRFLEIYAVRLGCTVITIESPVPGLIDFYKGLGFTRAKTKGTKVIRLMRTL